MSLKSIWKALTWPDPAETGQVVDRAEIVTSVLGRIALDASWGFEYRHLHSMFGDDLYLSLTLDGAKEFEAWARERYFRRPKWTERTDCEKLRVFGMAERLLAWQEIYPTEPLCAVGTIIFRRKEGGWHDTSFYLVNDNQVLRPVILEDGNGKFYETKETVDVVGYFRGP